MKPIYVLILSFSIILSFTLPKSVSARKDYTNSYNVVVSTHTLERGKIISYGDIELVRTNKNDPRALKDINLAIGKVLKRTIGKDTALKRDYLVDGLNTVKSVNRGRNVVIVIQMEGLKVSINGRLLKSAKVGDIVETENLSSGKIISGRLIDSKTVVVNY